MQAAAEQRVEVWSGMRTITGYKQAENHMVSVLRPTDPLHSPHTS